MKLLTEAQVKAWLAASRALEELGGSLISARFGCVEIMRGAHHTEILVISHETGKFESYPTAFVFQTEYGV